MSLINKIKEILTKLEKKKTTLFYQKIILLAIFMSVSALAQSEPTCYFGATDEISAPGVAWDDTGEVWGYNLKLLENAKLLEFKMTSKALASESNGGIATVDNMMLNFPMVTMESDNVKSCFANVQLQLKCHAPRFDNHPDITSCRQRWDYQAFLKLSEPSLFSAIKLYSYRLLGTFDNAEVYREINNDLFYMLSFATDLKKGLVKNNLASEAFDSSVQTTVSDLFGKAYGESANLFLGFLLASSSSLENGNPASLVAYGAEHSIDLFIMGLTSGKANSIEEKYNELLIAWNWLEAYYRRGGCNAEKESCNAFSLSEINTFYLLSTISKEWELDGFFGSENYNSLNIRDIINDHVKTINSWTRTANLSDTFELWDFYTDDVFKLITATSISSDACNSCNSLPIVSIVATDSDADESGNNTALFTFYRDSTSDNSKPLSVFFTLSGTANNSDYNAIPSSIEIPAGSHSVGLLIIPIQNDDGANEETKESLILTLSTNSTYQFTSSDNVASITISSIKEADDISSPVIVSVSLKEKIIYSNTATISISATDNIGISDYSLSTEFNSTTYDNLVWKPVSTTINLQEEIPYQLSYDDLLNGNHWLSSVHVWVRDAAGNVTSKLLNINTQNLNYQCSVPFSISGLEENNGDGVIDNISTINTSNCRNIPTGFFIKVWCYAGDSGIRMRVNHPNEATENFNWINENFAVLFFDADGGSVNSLSTSPGGSYDRGQSSEGCLKIKSVKIRAFL